MFPQLRKSVARIPKGKVATYGSVAQASGFPGAARQVAWALRATEGRLPWHRVLGAKGKILLPGEAGLEQRLRLKAEGVPFQGDRVDLARCEFDFGKRVLQKSGKSS